MQDVVGLAGFDTDFAILRYSMREEIFEYIGRKQSSADWRPRLPELARRLEEILFRKFSNKNDYFNMMNGPVEPQLQFAIKTLSAQNQQNQQSQQMSRQTASSSGYGTMIPTPGITQGTSGNSRMPYVTDNTGLSSSGAGMVPQNASMGTSLPGKLTNHPSAADRDAQNKEARQLRVQQPRKMLDLLVHASTCRSGSCQYPNCRKVKGLFRHGMQCKTRASGGCVLCKKIWCMLQLHARACRDSGCSVPRCRDLKEHLRRLQQQSDSRRRAAVNEMMRQRAAEVAANRGANGADYFRPIRDRIRLKSDSNPKK